MAAGWRGFVGRANGGMVVHIGVVVIAIGLAAATSFLHRGELHLAKGQSASFAGHTVTFVGTRQVTSPSRSAFEAVLRVDGGGMFYPAISQFGSGTQAVGTPAIDSSWRNDLYLTIDSIPTAGAPGPSGWWSSHWSCGCGSGPSWSASVRCSRPSPAGAAGPPTRCPTPVVAVSGPSDDDRRGSGPDAATGGRRSRHSRRTADPQEEAADPLPVGAGDPA